MKYIDLGLPSGTLWADENIIFPNTSQIDYCDYDTVIQKFKDNAPTEKDYAELVQYCKCRFIHQKGLVIVGPNKNSIFLPALGLYSIDPFPKIWAKPYAGYYWIIGDDQNPRTLSFNKEDNGHLPEHLDESRYELYGNHFCLRTIKK